MKPLPPPTPEDRAQAAAAAQALRQAWSTMATTGEKITFHVDLARPRRGEWWTVWSGLPGFIHRHGRGYTHVLLPGWVYSHSAIKSEMIPDLERLAATGERPTEATR
jgi:hypothetical protein